jgi:hypothetical protein
MLNIRTEYEHEPQTQPLETLYKEGCNINYSDIIETKKPRKGFNKPTLTRVDK